MDAVESKINNLVNQTITDVKRRSKLPRPKSYAEIVPERLYEKGLERQAISTGYPDLDYFVKGFIPGHLYLVTGSTNVGKSSIASNFSYNVAKNGGRVLYFSLEPGNQIIDFLTSIRTEKPFRDVTLNEISTPIDNIDIYSSGEVEKINDLVDIVNTLDRYDLIVVDHIGYFVSDTKNTNQEQSNVVKKLAALTKSRKCAIMMIAHLRKQPVGKKNYTPTHQDISGSGAFSQDTNEIFILTRKVKENNDGESSVEYLNIGEFIIAKSKSGPNGKLNVSFNEGGAKMDVCSSFLNPRPSTFDDDAELKALKKNIQSDRENDNSGQDDLDMVLWDV